MFRCELLVSGRFKLVDSYSRATLDKNEWKNQGTVISMAWVIFDYWMIPMLMRKKVDYYIPHKPLLYMFSRDQDSINYSINMENYYMTMFSCNRSSFYCQTRSKLPNNDLRCMWAMVWKKPLVTRSSRKCGFRRSKKQVSQRKKGPWLSRIIYNWVNIMCVRNI